MSPFRFSIAAALCALAILSAGGIRAGGPPVTQAATVHASLHYSNPVFAKDFPDPMVLRINAHSYYAYGTTVAWQSGLFPILHSTDLVHWKVVGSIFKRAPSWSQGDFWAPDVIKRGKTYYAYYTGSYLGVHCIGVATGRSPSGPFGGGRKIACADSQGAGYIDPDIFIDKDAKAYLYVSVDTPQHDISVIPLTKDLEHAAGPRKEVLGVTQAWEHGKNRATVEGPYVILHDGTYYLFFSGNDWEDTYQMGYATATSPTGPFTASSGNPIMQGDAKVHGPGGGSIVQGPDGNLWLVYHAWPGVQSYDQGGVRNMRIAPITWKGSVPSVQVTP